MIKRLLGKLHTGGRVAACGTLAAGIGVNMFFPHSKQSDAGVSGVGSARRIGSRSCSCFGRPTQKIVAIAGRNLGSELQVFVKPLGLVGRCVITTVGIVGNGVCLLSNNGPDLIFRTGIVLHHNILTIGCQCQHTVLILHIADHIATGNFLKAPPLVGVVDITADIYIHTCRDAVTVDTDHAGRRTLRVDLIDIACRNNFHLFHIAAIRLPCIHISALCIDTTGNAQILAAKIVHQIINALGNIRIGNSGLRI